MKLRVVSDLHFEYHVDGGETLASEVTGGDFDVLVVAGDLASSRVLAQSLSLIAGKTKRPIVYVVGNHEFYVSNQAHVEFTCKETAKAFPHLHYLNHEILELDGMRFLGTPLWYRKPTAKTWDFSKFSARCIRCERPLEIVEPVEAGAQLWCPQCSVLFLYDVSTGMTDYAVIENFASWVYTENARAREFLQEELEALDVVVTHYLPAERSIHADYKGLILNPFFLCDMEGLIRSRWPALWIHGHTHRSCDYMIEDSSGLIEAPRHTRVVCNPFGYVAHEENPGFDPELTVEV